MRNQSENECNLILSDLNDGGIKSGDFNHFDHEFLILWRSFDKRDDVTF